MALAFLKQHAPRTKRPQLVVRVNALDTGLTDADLDGVVAGKPDAILLPKAEGGPAVIHLDAKLTAREAIHGVHRRRDQDPGARDRDRGVAVRLRHLSQFKRRA